MLAAQAHVEAIEDVAAEDAQVARRRGGERGGDLARRHPPDARPGPWPTPPGPGRRWRLLGRPRPRTSPAPRARYPPSGLAASRWCAWPAGPVPAPARPRPGHPPAAL